MSSSDDVIHSNEKKSENIMKPFFSYENLNSLVQPYSSGFPYYRPFILHGKPQQIDLFLVGINPATSVFPEDGVGTDLWIETIMDYRLYDDRYSSNGRTRIGIRGFLNYIKKHYPYPFLETNINAYPTPKAVDLKKDSIKEAVIEGENRFIESLITHEPSIIILHSQQTTRYFIDILHKYKWISSRRVIKKTPIKHREQQLPHFTFFYSSGKKANVFACRHLKLFGQKGNSYKIFLDGLTPYLKGEIT